MFNTEDEILRRLQEKNLEMAVMFYKWCQRNHLTCYLCGGGCIGAIRHGGFIPWDDDLDFFMPRKDYEKFLKLWDTQEESKIYKLEYPKEGFCNAHTFANIRDSRTTQVKKEQVDMDLCHGVALDILPIEGYAPGNLARKWQVIEGKIFQLFCTQVIPTKERHGAFMHYLGTILLALAPTQKMRYRIWKQAENYITKFDIDSPRVDGITEMCAPQAILRKYPKKIFASAIEVPFENERLPIPVGYDTYLRMAFGDYMKLPPKEQQKGHHDAAFLDLDHPYEQYKGIYYCCGQRAK